MSDEVEGLDRVALRQTLGLVRDAPRPAQTGGMHPVREVVVRGTRVLVDPSARRAHGCLGHEPECDRGDDLLQASTQAHDHEPGVEVRQCGRLRLEAAQSVVAVDDLDVETLQAPRCRLAGLGNGTDQGDSSAVVKAREDVG